MTDAEIHYVPLSVLINTDEPAKEDLPAYEQRLAAALEAAIRSCRTASSGRNAEEYTPADVSRISWERIAERMLDGTGLCSGFARS